MAVTVAKSRKLIVAAVLLAAGYGLALAATGLSDFFWARRILRGPAADSANRVVGLDDHFRRRTQLLGTARLVPEAAANQSDAHTGQRVDLATSGSPAGHDNSVESGRANDSLERGSPPSWFVPLPQVSWIGAAADRPDEDAPARSLSSENSTTSAAPRESRIESTKLTRQPRARLTDVKPTGSAGARREASPWDRWPRWDPPAANTTAGVTTAATDHAIAATMQNSETTQLAAERASFEKTNAEHSARASYDAPIDLPVAEAAELRIHFVVDGDSLSRLADRYLDDPQLSDVIFQLNRDVLSDPELLPIGIELKIPERRVAPLPSRQSSRLRRLIQGMSSSATCCDRNSMIRSSSGLPT